MSIAITRGAINAAFREPHFLFNTLAHVKRLYDIDAASESRLQALQARVEPGFLFAALSQVRNLYDRDMARTSVLRASNMLDDLIAYLRAAMPHMRDTSSTVAQEIELVRAYLDIVRLRLGERLAVRIDVPPEAASMRMPPMMLLPLIDHAVVRGLEPSTAGGTISVRAVVDAGRLDLTIADSGAGFVPAPDGDGIAAIRECLTALYGDQGTLQFGRPDSRSIEAVLAIPLENRNATIAA